MLQLLRPRWGTRKSGATVDASRGRASHPGLSMLVERGHLGPEAVERALARAAETRQPLPVVLSELELLAHRSGRDRDRLRHGAAQHERGG